MNEGLSISKPQEHLNLNIKGVKPIITCIGSHDDFEKLKKDYPKHPNVDNNFDLKDAENIAWKWIDGKTIEEEFLNNGPFSYVISEINSSNKLSKNFYPCTGLIIAGITRIGKKISFLSHQSNKSILDKDKEEFLNHLEKQLTEIKKRCIDGTIDAVIVGGEYSHDEYQQYLEAIKLLRVEVNKVLDFEPNVINGPKEINGKDDIYYDNENRRLYFVRPKVNENIGSFTQSKIEEEKKKWE